MKRLTLTLHTKSGISLIEILIYIAIMSTLLVVSSRLIIDILRSQSRSSEVQRVLANVRHTLAILNFDVRNAADIDEANSTFDSNQGILVIVDRNGKAVRYGLSGTALTRTYATGTPEFVTTDVIDVEAFRVRYLSYSPKNLESMQVSLTISAGVTSTPHFYRKTYTVGITPREL